MSEQGRLIVNGVEMTQGEFEAYLERRKREHAEWATSALPCQCGHAYGYHGNPLRTPRCQHGHQDHGGAGIDCLCREYRP